MVEPYKSLCCIGNKRNGAESNACSCHSSRKSYYLSLCHRIMPECPAKNSARWNLMTTPHGRFNGYASCPPRMWVHSLGGVRPSHSTRIIWRVSHYAIGAILRRALTSVISDFGEVSEIRYRRHSVSEEFGFAERRAWWFGISHKRGPSCPFDLVVSFLLFVSINSPRGSCRGNTLGPECVPAFKGWVIA